ALSPTPHAAPPAQGLVQGATRVGTGHGGHAAGAAAASAGGRSSKGWVVALVAIGLVVVVLVGLGVRALSSAVDPGNNPGPGNQPTSQVCPDQQPQTASPKPDPADGRVHGGALSFPMLPEPFGPPEPDNRVPFGRDVQVQSAFVEDYSEGSWVASVMVAELIAGDGFFTPEQGSEIVVKCVLGEFYGSDTEVNREDLVNEARTLDGKDAWLVESHLTFDIPDLETKGETLILMIVATGEATASLFYASIPDTSPQFMAPAREAMENLRVDA
ncbi:hypothetical protein, partial [Desertihabitans aurantiacus]|uniref:hypothetical protein n=1 Tax=Desertihabitans aurantiacus TaxID=2282477 RepID=UPI0018E56BFA